jgi:hypothetical protein
LVYGGLNGRRGGGASRPYVHADTRPTPNPASRGYPGVLFVSEIHGDASPGPRYIFNAAASAADPDVPFTADYGTTYLLSLVDDDTGSNTTMVQARVQLPSLYRRDNATRDALTVRGQRGFTAVLHGNWVY